MRSMILAAVLLQAAAQAEVVRADHFVERGEDRLFVREVSSGEPRTGLPPILLLHGARVPGVPSFDLAVPGGSLAADLAVAGHTVYVMDALGYGRSTRPAAMAGQPQASPPLARTNEVARDVHAVVEWIGQRRGVERVALVGWATAAGDHRSISGGRRVRRSISSFSRLWTAMRPRRRTLPVVDPQSGPGRAERGQERLATSRGVPRGYRGRSPLAG